MAEDDANRSNGIPIYEGEMGSDRQRTPDLTLYTIFSCLIADIFFPNPNSEYSSVPFLHRIKASLSVNCPLLRDASRNTARNVLLWIRRGSPLRALLAVSVGTIALLTLTGLLVFMLFFVAATFNAVVISLLMSLAAAGGFLAIFFTCVVAIYIGALATAVFIISTATISAVIAVLIATGWIGFFWTLWLAAKKSINLTKQVFYITGSTVSSYSTALHSRNQFIPKKSD